MHFRFWCVLILVAVFAACSSPRARKPIALEDNTTPPTEPLTDASVQAFTRGQTGFPSLDDILPMMSDGEGYTEKWEFRSLEGEWRMRFKFQVANLGFGDYKGLLSGYVMRYDAEGKEVLERYTFRQKFSEGDWDFEDDRLEIRMGEQWKLWGQPGEFFVEGIATEVIPKNEDEEDDDETADEEEESVEEDDREPEVLRFRYAITGEPWKPGTGLVLFGADNELYYKTHILVTDGVARGELERANGERIQAPPGRAYGNHFATNLGGHELTERTTYFRKHEGPLYVEWRHMLPPQTYNFEAFSYIVVAYDGVVLFESTDVELAERDFWTDPDNYNYVVPQTVVVRAKNGDHEALLSLTSQEIDVRDPLAKLPSLERSVALRFAQPMDYSFKGGYRLDLKAFGQTSTVQGEGSFTTTVLR